MDKICSKCGKTKDISLFAKDRHSSDGYTYWCKDCRNTANKKYRKENPDKVQEHNEKWKDKRKEYYSLPKNQEKLRRHHLKKMYNITLEDYDALFQLQGGVCAICGKPETSSKASNLAVDHNHTNGSIRGLLCNKCNRGLGYFEDDATILSKAIEYLKNKDNV